MMRKASLSFEFASPTPSHLFRSLFPSKSLYKCSGSTHRPPTPSSAQRNSPPASPALVLPLITSTRPRHRDDLERSAKRQHGHRRTDIEHY
jgi:hypothetical protein